LSELLIKPSLNKKVTSNFKLFDTVIFEDFPDVTQKLWPAHCIKESNGAELHENLKKIDPEFDPMNRKVFYAKKGTNPDIDSYSPFFNNYRLNETDLHYQLEKEKITDLYICGIAYDVCVGKFISFDLINFLLKDKYILFH